jgi:hypothetical protein
MVRRCKVMADNFNEKYNTKEFNKLMKDYDEGHRDLDAMKNYFNQCLNTYNGSEGKEMKDYFSK